MSLIYDSALRDEAQGELDFDTHAFKVLLVSAAYVPNAKTHAKRSDITNEVTGLNWPTGGVTVLPEVVLDTATDVAEVTFSQIVQNAVSITGATQAVYYRARGGAASSDELVMCVDLGKTLSPSLGQLRLAASKYRKTRGSGGTVVGAVVSPWGVSCTGQLGSVTAYGTTAPVNTPPVWSQVGNFTAIEGIAEVFPVGQLVTDPENDPLVISLESGQSLLPPGWSFNAGAVQMEYDGAAGVGTSGPVCRLAADDGAITVVVQPTGLAAQGHVGVVIAQSSPDTAVSVLGVQGIARLGSVTAGTSSGVAGYPITHTIPTEYEASFSDMPELVNGQYYTGATWYYRQQTRDATNEPGFYAHNTNAPVRWLTIGGDWFDSTGTANGSSFYARTTITVTTEKWVSWTSSALTQLVRDWASHALPNWGFFLVGADANLNQFRSRFSTTTPSNAPELLLDLAVGGPLTISCERSIWLSSGGTTTQAGSPEFRVSEGPSSKSRGLLRFDLTGIDPSNIVTATLRCYSFKQWGQSTIHIMRVRNPSPALEAAEQQLGLAAGYDKDQGIEGHPSVYFTQPFADVNYKSRWAQGPDQYLGATELVTGANSDGITGKLAGTYNWLRCRHRPQAEIGNLQSAIEAEWCFWREISATSFRPRAFSYPIEAYLRYYLTWGYSWDPSPAGGKMPGWDMRFRDHGYLYPVVPGMNRGNSGSGTDGFTGGSCRGNYDRYATIGSPIENFRGIANGDCYALNQTGQFGIDIFWDKNYLAQLRKGEVYCIESYIRLNDVSDPEAKPLRIREVNSAGGVATVTLWEDISNYPYEQTKYVNNSLWAVGGFGNSDSSTQFWPYAMNKVAPITVVDGLHFQYPVDANAPPLIPRPQYPNGVGNGPSGDVWLVCAPTYAIPNGIVRGWVNGRLAGEKTDLQIRHCAWTTDRSRPFSLDCMWFCVFQGGGSAADRDFSLYVADVVLASEYIGPMVGYP